MKFVVFYFLIVTVAVAEVLVGKATNDQGEFVYTEEHVVDRDDQGRAKHIVTTYFDPNGRKIAQMDSDFEGKLSAPNSKFEDFRFDRVFEGKHLKIDNKDVYQIAEFNSKKKVKTTDLEFKTDLVSGPGFDNYIKENLIRKKVSKSSVHFLVLPRHDYYRFEVIAKGTSSDSNQEYVIKPSLVLSLFVKEIRIYYDEKSGLLKRYVGLSNLPSALDKPQSVTIEYQTKDSPKSESL